LTDLSTQPLRGVAVLVVEDHYYQADETRRALEAAGAAVLGPYGSAAEALRSGEPDCAVLDINLGAGADFALARVMASRGVPLVLLTGYDEKAIPTDLWRAAHLSKPAEAWRIVATVKSQLSAWSMSPTSDWPPGARTSQVSGPPEADIRLIPQAPA
jgi:DNA-binding LytR/AlgR family response regulator